MGATAPPARAIGLSRRLKPVGVSAGELPQLERELRRPELRSPRMTQLIHKSDEHLQREVECELRQERAVRHTDVGVGALAGVVMLAGTVASPAQRIAAQKAAHRVPGVLDVANDIQIKLLGSPERAGVDIARAVRRALDWSTLLPWQRIHSTVSDGVVTLEGSVEYRSQLRDVVRVVRKLIGVRHVNNLIAVDDPAAGLSPLAVRNAIESALDQPPSTVKIAVDTGKVTLEGEVPSRAERSVIEHAARGAPGVRHVANRLRVRSRAAALHL
jgi:osmotically-inducible protein OsmY